MNPGQGPDIAAAGTGPLPAHHAVQDQGRGTRTHSAALEHIMWRHTITTCILGHPTSHRKNSKSMCLKNTLQEMAEKLGRLKDSGTGNPRRRATITWSARLGAEGPHHTRLVEK